VLLGGRIQVAHYALSSRGDSDDVSVGLGLHAEADRPPTPLPPSFRDRLDGDDVATVAGFLVAICSRGGCWALNVRQRQTEWEPWPSLPDWPPREHAGHLEHDRRLVSAGDRFLFALGYDPLGRSCRMLDTVNRGAGWLVLPDATYGRHQHAVVAALCSD